MDSIRRVSLGDAVMDSARPVLFLVVGVVLTAAFFLLGLDHLIGRLFQGGHSGGIALAIVPPNVQNGCPPTYAIDNRTNRDVLFTLAGATGGYGPPSPDDSRTNDPSYYRGASSYSPGSTFGDADMMGLGGDLNPESAEPGIKETEDAYPGDSNYGGSSSQYGNDGPRQYDEGYYGAPPDNYHYGNSSSYSYRSDAGMYAQSGAYPQGPPPRDAYAGGSSLPPPLSSQSIPLTPPDNSSPYGAPASPQYGDPRDRGYGPPANRVRPGEIFFASTGGPQGPDGPPPGCDQSGNTVTVQLSD
jgi:hypothetical protein